MDVGSARTCLGTPTLGPALPVDIREPLGGMLTLNGKQAQSRWRMEVSRLRVEAPTRCQDGLSELISVMVGEWLYHPVCIQVVQVSRV